jgi:hypothetical protein
LVQLGEFARNQGAYWFDKTNVYDYSGNEIRVLRRKSFNIEFPVDTCRMFDTQEGRLILRADPLASLVVFTPSFSYNGVPRVYEPQTTRILELDNFGTDPADYEIENLPTSVSVCHRMGTQIKLVKEIAKALIDEESKCGQNSCTSLVHSRYGLNGSLEEQRYSKEDFEGKGLAKLAKQARIYPYYEEYYSLKKDILDELGQHGTN